MAHGRARDCLVRTWGGRWRRHLHDVDKRVSEFELIEIHASQQQVVLIDGSGVKARRHIDDLLVCVKLEFGQRVGFFKDVIIHRASGAARRWPHNLRHRQTTDVETADRRGGPDVDGAVGHAGRHVVCGLKTTAAAGEPKADRCVVSVRQQRRQPPLPGPL